MTIHRTACSARAPDAVVVIRKLRASHRVTLLHARLLAPSTLNPVAILRRESRIQLFGRGAQLGGDVALDALDGLALESPDDGAGSSSDEQGGSDSGDDESDSGAEAASVLQSSAVELRTYHTCCNGCMCFCAAANTRRMHASSSLAVA